MNFSSNIGIKLVSYWWHWWCYILENCLNVNVAFASPNSNQKINRSINASKSTKLFNSWQININMKTTLVFAVSFQNFFVIFANIVCIAAQNATFLLSYFSGKKNANFTLFVCSQFVKCRPSFGTKEFYTCLIFWSILSLKKAQIWFY